MTKTKNQLLWVKLPSEQASHLTSIATLMGVSRADLMRLIITNFLHDAKTQSEGKIEFKFIQPK